MKNLFLFVFLFSFTLNASELKIEPLYSVENTRRDFPKPSKMVTKTYLGISAIYGTPKLSGEFQIAQSSNTDLINDDTSKVTSTTRQAMLGVKFYPLTSSIFGAFLRFGARGKQELLDIKDEKGSRKEELPIHVDPYAGAGFSIVLSQKFSLNAGATLIYNGSNTNVKESQRYDVQYTFSTTMKMGNR